MRGVFGSEEWKWGQVSKVSQLLATKGREKMGKGVSRAIYVCGFKMTTLPESEDPLSSNMETLTWHNLSAVE